MKVLILSLLKLGDFLQQVPLLRDLRQEGNEIHLLVNESLQTAVGLFPEFQFHFFPRDEIQKNLTNTHCNVMGSFWRVETLVDTLNNEEFEAIENWTHNFLSARLMDLLQAPIKKGAQFQDGALVSSSYDSGYMNETWGLTKAASFHYVDTLARAKGHDVPQLQTADLHRVGPVLMQVFTGDTKKNWPLQNWRALADQLKSSGEDVRIVCAPFEEVRLREQGWQDGHSVCVLELQELNEALATAKIVITGDTSVAHLAALQRTPILALFLGPADPRKTAPRQIGARILWAKTSCSPCRHSEDCSQLSQICAESLTIETVFQEVIQMIQHEPGKIGESSIHRLEVQAGPTGALIVSDRDKQSMSLWAQVVWDFYLNRDHDSLIAPYGSAGRVILQSWGHSKSTREWVEQTKLRLEASFEIIGNVSETLWELMRDFNKNQQLSSAVESHMRNEVLRLADLWKETDFVTKLVESNLSSDANPFLRIKHRKEALQEVFELFSVQKSLIRVLDQELKENGGHRGART